MHLRLAGRARRADEEIFIGARRRNIEQPQQLARSDLLHRHHVTHQRHAVAVDGRAYQHRQILEHQAAGRLRQGQPGRAQPRRPRFDRAQQSSLLQVLERLWQPSTAIVRTHYRIVDIAHQALHHHARIVAAAEADADIDRIPRQVLQLPARLQHYLDIGMQVDEAASRGASQRAANEGIDEIVRRLLALVGRSASAAMPMSTKALPSTWAKRRPSGVTLKWRPLRTNSATPSSSSSARTWWLIAPWVRCNSSAAREKFWWRAAASKARRAAKFGRRLSLIVN